MDGCSIKDSGVGLRVLKDELGCRVRRYKGELGVGLGV